MELQLTQGNIHDCTQAPDLLSGATCEAIIADKGYDSDAIINLIQEHGMEAIIPPKSNRASKREYNKHIYKERNLVERFFNRIKQYRGLATRYEKTSVCYLAMLHMAASRIWLL